MHNPGSRRLRSSRWSEHNRPYMCTAKVEHRQPVFSDIFVGRLVVNAMRFSDANGWTSTYAFVLMPDHLHWVFELTGSKSLSEVMAAIKRRSARAINRHFERTGTFWQDGFHDHAVRREETLEHVCRYVVMNPVRAGLVESIEDYSLWDWKWE